MAFGHTDLQNSAWWCDGNRIQEYLEISLPEIAGLLTPGYLGYSSRIKTNIPALYDQFPVNRYPERLSMFGVIDYCVTEILSLRYGVCITDYFWFGRFDNSMIPVAIMLLIMHAIVFAILNSWNRPHVQWNKFEVVSWTEMK